MSIPKPLMPLALFLLIGYFSLPAGSSESPFRVSSAQINHWYRVQTPEQQTHRDRVPGTLQRLLPLSPSYVSIYRLPLIPGERYTVQCEYLDPEWEGSLLLSGLDPLSHEKNTQTPDGTLPLIEFPSMPALQQDQGPLFFGFKRNFRVSPGSVHGPGWLIATSAKPASTLRFRVIRPAQPDNEVRRQAYYYVAGASAADSGEELWLGPAQDTPALNRRKAALSVTEAVAGTPPRAQAHATLPHCGGRSRWVLPSADVGAAPPAEERGLWIEAEAEYAYHITSDHSGHEAKLPHSGPAYWQLVAGGDWVEYQFTIPEDDIYYIWIRYFDDGTAHPSHREARVSLNGVTLAHVPGHRLSQRDSWGWTRVAWGRIPKASHVLRITKSHTTGSPALIDAIFVTPDGDAVPSELAGNIRDQTG